MSARRTPAPYAAGDKINLLRTEAAHGTVWGPLTIDRVVTLTDGRHWRIEATRHDATPVHVVVDRTGRDPHDYAAPPRRPAASLAQPVIPV